jgi:exopolysaccharide biosynthesis polyprenyl glycosylphosphotransferase
MSPVYGASSVPLRLPPLLWSPMHYTFRDPPAGSDLGLTTPVVRERGLAVPTLRASDASVSRATARRRMVRRTLLTADLLGIVLVILAAGAGSGAVLGEHTDSWMLGATLLPAWLMTSAVARVNLLDAERADHGTTNEFMRVTAALFTATWLAALTWALIGVDAVPSLEALTLMVFIGSLLLGLVRVPARAIVRRNPAFRQRTIVVGAGDVGPLIAQRLQRHPEFGIDLLGFVDTSEDAADTGERDGTTSTMQDRLADLEHTVRGDAVDRAFIVGSWASDALTAAAVRRLEQLGIQVDIVPPLFELVGPRAAVHTVEGLPMIGLPPAGPTRVQALAKRGLDATLAGLAIVVLSPVFAALALRVRADSPGPVFYRSRRIGRGGRRILVMKFRTMRLEACRGPDYGGDDAELAFAQLMGDPDRRAEFLRTHKLREDPRVTKIGSFLRRTSIDELPQLWDVVRGELSLVGPRAITVEEHEDIALSAAPDGPAPYWEFPLVRPGLTGYWQVHGRSLTSYAERLWLDEMYMTSISLRLDVLILGRTVRELVGRRGL